MRKTGSTAATLWLSESRITRSPSQRELRALSLRSVARDVMTETERQYDLHGPVPSDRQTGTDTCHRYWANLEKSRTDQAAREGTLTWFQILIEEVAEARAETDWPKLREELVQVAAVAASWVEDGDKKHAAQTEFREAQEAQDCCPD